MQSREGAGVADGKIRPKYARHADGHPPAVVALVQLLAQRAAEEDFAAALEAVRAKPLGQKARRRDETG